jgi:hypothetical protein
MKVHLDANVYEVSESAQNNILKRGYDEALNVYHNIVPDAIAALADVYARKQLLDMERKAFAAGISKEDAKKIRPGDNETASEKLLGIMIAGLKDMLQYAEIGFITDNNGQITDFTYKLKDQSQTGRQLANTGKKGKR